jgi:hypothetical protein
MDMGSLICRLPASGFHLSKRRTHFFLDVQSDVVAPLLAATSTLSKWRTSTINKSFLLSRELQSVLILSFPFTAVFLDSLTMLMLLFHIAQQASV